MNFDPTQLIKFAFVRYSGDLKRRGLCSLSSPKMKLKTSLMYIADMGRSK